MSSLCQPASHIGWASAAAFDTRLASHTAGVPKACVGLVLLRQAWLACSWGICPACCVCEPRGASLTGEAGTCAMPILVAAHRAALTRWEWEYASWALKARRATAICARVFVCVQHMLGVTAARVAMGRVRAIPSSWGVCADLLARAPRALVNVFQAALDCFELVGRACLPAATIVAATCEQATPPTIPVATFVLAGGGCNGPFDCCVARVPVPALAPVG